MKGTRVLVTGASGDLGRAIVDHMLDAGAEVILHAHRREPVQKGVAVRRADLTDPDQLAALIDGVTRDFDGLDVLVNNAGGGRPRSLRELSTQEWSTSLALNLTAPFRLIQGLLPLLRARRGAVVNVSSVAALTGGAFGPHYAATKAGLIGLTRSSARELGPLGIRVNAIAPGPVASDMTDLLSEEVMRGILAGTALRRVVSPAEIAAAVAYLAQATAVTGQVLVVDAGRHFV